MLKDAAPAHSIQPTPTAPDLSILTFQIEAQAYGLLVTDVLQIIKIVTLTRLPQLPPAIQGIINLRGKLVPVLDLRLHFGLPFKPYRLHTPIILVNFNEQTLGLVVDTVDEVVQIAAADLETQAIIAGPQPDSGQIPGLTGVAKVGRRLIPILKTESLLSPREQTQLMDQLALHKR